MKNLFKEAHSMAKEIKAQYPDVNYSFQFSLCLKYLQTVKEEIKVVELQGSEKQITWATEIRNYVSNEILTAIGQIEVTKENHLLLIEEIKNDMENESSKYWIETFGCTKFDKAKPMFTYLTTKNFRLAKQIARQINKNNGFDCE